MTTKSTSSDSSYYDDAKENANAGEQNQGDETVDDDLNFLQRPSYANFEDQSYRMPELTTSIVRKLDDEFMLMEDGPEKIRTYLRIRPSSKNSKTCLAQLSSELYTVEGPSVLKINGHQSIKRVNPYADETKFTFSRIFGPECSQSTVFEECVQPILESFLAGESCLVFSYGATNSGKTFTMQGYGTQFGIVPRTLEYTFNYLEDKLYTNGNIKPNYYSAFQSLTEAETKVLEDTKQRLLNQTTKHKIAEMNSFRASFSRLSSSTSSFSSGTAVLVDKIINSNQQPSYNHCAPNASLYAVWVSFAEIYNERVYDLFENVPKGKRRKEMKLLTDKEGRVYIKDLTEVCANNAEEAYQLFLAGKSNLQFAATQANLQSSRSHSFFNIRMVSVGVTHKIAYPRKVFQISFCDLAGIERVSQTGNMGIRLKESGNINQSLFVLLKCIRAMRDKQLKIKNPSDVLPFRESKLARLFQGYLTTATHTCMVVNINPDPDMFESSLQVLQNSAIASEIITYRRVEPPCNDSKFYRRVRDSIGLANQFKDQLNSTGLSDVYSDDEYGGATVVAKSKVVVEAMADKVARLEAENSSLKKQLMTIEERIRKEMLESFAAIQREYDQDQRELLQEREAFSNNMQERRVSIAAKIWNGTKEDKSVGTSPALIKNRIESPCNAALESSGLATPENGISISNIRKEWNSVMQENHNLKVEIDDWKSTCQALQDTINDRNSLIAKYQVEKVEIESLHANKVSDLQRMIKLQEEEIAHIKQSDPEKLQDTSMNQFHDLKQKLKEQTKRAEDSELELAEAVKTCREYHEKLTEANDKITQMPIDYHKLFDENKNLVEENELLHLSVDDLTTQLERLNAQKKLHDGRVRTRRNL